MNPTRSPQNILPKILFGTQGLCLLILFCCLFIRIPPIFLTSFLFLLETVTLIVFRAAYKADSSNHKGVFLSMFLMIGLTVLVALSFIAAFLFFLPLIYFAPVLRGCIYFLSAVILTGGVLGLVRGWLKNYCWLSVYALAVMLLYIFSAVIYHVQMISIIPKELVIFWMKHLGISLLIGTAGILCSLAKRKPWCTTYAFLGTF